MPLLQGVSCYLHLTKLQELLEQQQEYLERGTAMPLQIALFSEYWQLQLERQLPVQAYCVVQGLLVFALVLN